MLFACGVFIQIPVNCSFISSFSLHFSVTFLEVCFFFFLCGFVALVQQSTLIPFSCANLHFFPVHALILQAKCLAVWRHLLVIIDLLSLHIQGCRFLATMAENNYSWWKLTFLRKKKSTPKVLYESPDIYDVTNNENQQEGMLADGGNSGSSEREFNARLEKIVDKSTKGKHVKVSHSGRFKEKKKVRATLSENPNFFADSERDEK